MPTVRRGDASRPVRSMSRFSRQRLAQRYDQAAASVVARHAVPQAAGREHAPLDTFLCRFHAEARIKQ
jgi:hypothetical protein